MKLAFLLVVGAAFGCQSDQTLTHAAIDSISPSAKLETFEMLRADLGVKRHVSDGGGRAWIEDRPDRIVAGTVGTFEIVFEVGPEGIAEGGGLYFMPSPFWGWSTPQTLDSDYLGFTQVDVEAEGVELEPLTLDEQLLFLRVVGRPLGPGEQVRLRYSGMVDRYAESDSRFWIAVDGDGDGARSVLPDSPGVKVEAGPPARIVITVPSVVRPGETATATVAVLDALGNAGVGFEGEVALEVLGAEVAPLPPLVFSAVDRGVATVEFHPRAQGTLLLVGLSDDGLEGVSNPMVVSTEGSKIYWGDLHGHSGISDGTGTAEDYLAYARDVSALDVVALTDHDHWGIVFLDQAPELQEEIRRQTEIFYDPGRFVTLHGYEWTNWVHGHRHVLFFADKGEVLSSVDPRYDTPAELWETLRGREALTVAHHSAGGPVATNWDYPPDPELEPVTEVASVHGSSEAADSPRPIYSAVPGNFVRDVLDRGYRLGFVGSGDSHDGHPGLAHLGSGTGGLAAFVTDDLTREGVFDALRSRRVYATNGPRIILRMAVEGRPMGSTFTLDQDRATVFVSVVAVAPVERVDLVRSGEIVASAGGDGATELEFLHPLEGLEDGEYVYVRVVQVDGGAAWASPVFIDKK